MKNLKYIFVFSLICVSVFSATRFVLAEDWTPPTTNPPAGNTSAPVNVSNSPQAKVGDFTTDGYLRGATLRSFGRAVLNYATAAEMSSMPVTFLDLALAVKGKVGANNYCDERGENCFTPGQVATIITNTSTPTGGGSTTGTPPTAGNIPSGGIVMFMTACPTGWSEITALQGKMPIGASSVYPLGSTGGNSSVTLTVGQLPSHNHRIHPDSRLDRKSVRSGSSHNVWAPGGEGQVDTGYAGGGEAINIMNPYYSIVFCKKD